MERGETIPPSSTWDLPTGMWIDSRVPDRREWGEDVGVWTKRMIEVQKVERLRGSEVNTEYGSRLSCSKTRALLQTKPLKKGRQRKHGSKMKNTKIKKWKPLGE